MFSRPFSVVVLAMGAFAQMEGMGGMGSGRRMRDKEPLAVKSDVACIACDVCEIATVEIHREVEAQRAKAPMVTASAKPGAPKKERSSFSEVDVNKIVLEVCNRRKELGEWMWYVDLVESASWDGLGALHRDLTKKEKTSAKNFLLVEERDRASEIRKWDRESASVKRSCERLWDEDIADLEELIVPLWRGVSAKEATKLACRELSSRCTNSRAAVPKGREDFEYVGQDKQLLETERMMQNMEEQGMPMVMQSREDMMDELRDSMVEEGMTEEEAEQFIASTTAMSGGGDAPEPMDGGFEPMDGGFDGFDGDDGFDGGDEF